MTARMRVMVHTPPQPRLAEAWRAVPEPGAGEVVLRVHACGVCRTDLHIVDGELPGLSHPVVPGHEIVGTVTACGPGVTRIIPGQRVGVPWLGWTCGACAHCLRGEENLCDLAEFTGYQRPGGYAEYALADARYALPLPDIYPDVEAAPLLCAGLIGYRALVKAGDAPHLGIYGFGAAGHLLAQLAAARGQTVYAFTRPGDLAAQAFARAHGASWAGGSDESPPVTLDGAILLAPVGALVPTALRHLRKGGTVVCGGIHMSDIPAFPYALLWGERRVVSVANLTRADGLAFMALAAQHRLRVAVTPYPLAAANQALDDLRAGCLQGVAVLEIGSGAGR